MTVQTTNAPVTKNNNWRDLEGFLDDIDGMLKKFGQKAEATAGEAQVQTHLALMDAEELWAKAKGELLTAVARLREAQEKPKAVLEEGKIELYFGKLDAKAAVAQLRERLDATERDIIELGKAANGDAKAALQRLKDAYEAIKGKLLH